MTFPDGVTTRPLTIPRTMDAADAGEFAESTRVRNEIYREITGSDHDALSPDELLPHYQPSPEEIRHSWIVLDDDRIIGRIGVDVPFEEGSRSAFWLIELLSAHHGRGIGSAAYALVEQTARDQGRTVLQSWAQHPDAPGRRLSAPTGFGSIPEDHAARFYLRHGYTLEQIERESALDLQASVDDVARLLHEAEAAATGYRVVQWTAPTPPERVDGYAWMKSRMSTDTPAGALEFDEEVWDAARVARHDRKTLDGGRTMLVTAAQHIASGDLVAFNELTIGSDRTAVSHQEDTLVLAEHRGHRLGLLVKCAGLRTWRAEVAPLSPRMITYNAEENRPMLDINEAIGFAPLAYNGAWKKVLS
ncbi:GNAT family N-acetyltransferase [Microbacterium dextranolyticum]|uniref:GNAT family N-acetyltransferase n=1 Tax=Microbacterium dextranolyticum TaxID=36806 RepID=A0A9W6HP88_9MICO|nr:GNAT family N-acetyltransferase [Microbacterium dextranolyticum]MBM7462762.1 GNAT superfamily N-acetyltransferase [Microbacterium dextranolyticum]GLJ96133.1 GNAT family N-acetyltransferase [Microbacterium dextranolyticum]